jgi:thiosulfate reductase cytochrome b subunit
VSALARNDTGGASQNRRWIYRHSALVRLTHWINAVCLAGLLMSGLQIFNAHPALYWGKASDFDRPLLSIRAEHDEDQEPVSGITAILGREFDTTGVLGLSAGPDGEYAEVAFPGWITVPAYRDLATGRRWHFFFAWLLVLNGAAYLISGFFSGHFRRDLVPDRGDLRHIGRSIADHARLRFPKGDEAKRYNVLQKLSYLVVIFVLLPVMILAGMAMSPALDAAFPWLVSLFGGRQAARTVHFIAANLIVLFFLVHVVMVLLSGVWNNIRSMITGRYDIESRVDEKIISR